MTLPVVFADTPCLKLCVCVCVGLTTCFLLAQSVLEKGTAALAKYPQIKKKKNLPLCKIKNSIPQKLRKRAVEQLGPSDLLAEIPAGAPDTARADQP